MTDSPVSSVIDKTCRGLERYDAMILSYVHSEA